VNPERKYPPLAHRLFSVWYRHVMVYGKNIFSNGLPPFMEPLIFLAGIGLGLGQYIVTMEGMPYIKFLGTGLLVTTAMFTASFECSFGTFIRLEFDKVYDGMLSAPISVNDLLIGEILWAGTKGLFFSFAVLVIMTAFRIIPLPWSLFAPLVGFVTGVMFASLSLLITSFVKTINHFSFFFTGLLSPMFFFSGVVFPVENLPAAIQPITWVMPLTHVVRLVRAFTADNPKDHLLWSILYIVLFTTFTAYFAIKRLTRRLVT
jgi:lipooligosaccharide transport system permease protein